MELLRRSLPSGDADLSRAAAEAREGLDLDNDEATITPAELMSMSFTV